MSECPACELIRSLTDLVWATKAVIASTDEGNNDSRRGNTGGSIENLVEDSVRQLLPSVRQSRNPSLGSSFSINSSLVHNPSKRHPTPKEIWSQSFKKRSDKYPPNRTARKKTCKTRKVTQTIKDIFLLNDPAIDTVPHKSERQFFCQHGLTACAVKFTSDMLEDDIIQHISKQFQLWDHQFSSQSFLF